MVEGKPIPMRCREDCTLFKRYGFRSCGDGISFEVSACTNTMKEICDVIGCGGKYKTRVAGATFYRRSASKPDSDSWREWSNVGTLEDGNFVPVTKK